MAIITFWNSRREETGKTLALAAIATYMSIEHNVKNLIVSTTDREDKLKRCFWEEKKKSKFNLGIFGPNANNILEKESGVNGLAKMIRSNKITPDIITNYTKVVFKERLEVLLGCEQPGKDDIMQSYPDIISTADQAYEYVFVDLDYNVPTEVRQKILEKSDIVIMSLSQRLSSIEAFLKKKEQDPLLKSSKTLLLIGRYDKFSKYNSKNITRYLGEKNQVLTIPYNTLFFEAAEEAGVPDLFLRFRKFIDPEDRNAFFISEIKRVSENIIYRLQMIQAGM
jgi:hypothetical protein